MNNKDTQLSKSLSWLLRHGAVKEGLFLSPEGYISVQQVLQHKSFRGQYNVDDIERVVNTNNKKRFKLRFNTVTRDLEIKANQGHSIKEVDNSDLRPVLQPQFPTIVHGTYLKCWPSIRTQGLSRMQRKHIHFAKGTLGDVNVISGLRKDVQIYIFIDLEKALTDGIKFYESENEVLLTEGNEKGYLEPKYFSKVVEVKTGFPSYTKPQDLIQVFTNYGSVKVEKLNNKYAILVFSNEDEAAEAIEDTNKVVVYGDFLTVKLYNAKDDAKKNQQERQFPRSKQKAGVIVDPKLLDLSGDFHQQLDTVLAAVRLTQEEVMTLSRLYADIERVLQQNWPGCVAMPFGSITTGLGIKTSDADCFINVPQSYRSSNPNFVNRAKRVLNMYPNLFTEVLSIPRANTPIVKLFHIPTETNCDVTFKTPLGAQNSKLIAFLLHADPRLIPMAVVIKYWAKVHGFSGTGKLTNYALTMLIIFYLQQPPVSILPSVEWLQRDSSTDIIIDNWNTGFMIQHELLPRSTNSSSISELLGGFFQYYSTFDFKEMIVCPFLGTPVKKDVFKDFETLPNEFARYKTNIENRLVQPLRFTTPMCVQDPFELCHNVASAITGRLAMEITEYFKFAAAAYDKEKLNNCEGLLRTVLLQKPKLPRGKSNPEYRAVVYPHIIKNIIDPDWRSVIRGVLVDVIFGQICKIQLSKVEEKPNPESKKVKEKYSGAVTKAIWKRKQFTKLYNAMKLDFLEKQKRITEEITTVDKEVYDIRFQFTLTFGQDAQNAAAAVKLTEGDTSAFKEFGNFFMWVMQSWFFNLLRPQLKLRENQNSENKINDKEERGGSVDADNGKDKDESLTTDNEERDNENAVNVNVVFDGECDTSVAEDEPVKEQTTNTQSTAEST